MSVCGPITCFFVCLFNFKTDVCVCLCVCVPNYLFFSLFNFKTHVCVCVCPNYLFFVCLTSKLMCVCVYVCVCVCVAQLSVVLFVLL